MIATFRVTCALFGLVLMAGCVPGDGTAIADPTSKKDSEAAKTGKKKHPANRLAKESSPYLLLHAHNPVDWYPWGPAAFAKAKKENKPVFLSIGYSSCYWCHVMERLVFENEKIAKYMNKHFVCIKVDREERPDVDDIYMTSLQIYFQATGSSQGGGWPLSMFLTPEGKPIAGGTYFPPEDKAGRVGFATVTARVHDLWTKEEKGIRSNADRLTEMVRRAMKPRPVLKPVKLERQLADDVIAALIESHDTTHGGIGYREGARNPSKFPTPAKLALLQYDIKTTGNKKAAKALYHTLDRIAAGGIHDHLGGGFHRYSTDRYWHVPHFEKMLYDQAQLADVYIEAFQQTRKPAYREAAEGIFQFVLREMTDAKGGFYSALDAETDGVEGKHYVWSLEEITTLLGEKDAKLFNEVYGINEPKRFEHGYVLHLPKPLAEIAKARKTPLPELKKRLQGLRAKLLSARQKRKSLLRDDKILASWNGLMIRAFANGGRVFKEPKYTKAAEKAALFLLNTARDDKRRLLRTYRNGTAKLNAYVDDYAFLIAGLLAIQDATGKEKWLNAARRLYDDQQRDYWCKEAGGFYFTRHDHEELIARTRNAFDAVLPSGNAVSARNLLTLARRTKDAKYRQQAKELLQAFAPNLENFPTGMAHVALAVAEFADSAQSPKKPTEKPVPPKKAEKTQPLKATGQANKKSDELVTANAYLEYDKLPVGKSCRVAIVVDIKTGWHVATNPAVPKSGIPTVLSVVSKAGVKLTDITYPKGEELLSLDGGEPQMVYEGRVTITGVLKVPANIQAKLKAEDLEFRIRYQACNDTVCRRPKTAKLVGRVAFARGNDSPKAVNQSLFRSKTKSSKTQP